MGRKIVAWIAGAAIVGAWVICAVRYATVGGGAYNDGVFVPLVLLAVMLSVWAAVLITQAWNGSSAVAAVGVAVPAVVAVLILALAIGLRG